MKKILILTGATASGKSAVALEIAEKKNGVIINADSQQMYAELRILTARPTPQEEARAPHKLYGAISASENCSAGKWLNLARMEIDWALSQGKLPIVVGGSGLYLKALLHGIAEMPDIPAEIRAQSISDYEQMGKEAFAQRLKEVDAAFFTRLKTFDKQRLTRAWEVWLGTGKPLSWWQSQDTQPIYPADNFTIWQMDLPRDALYARCNARFKAMMEQGAVEEVREMWRCKDVKRKENSPHPHIFTSSHPLLKIIGVSEISAHLRGEISLEQAIARAQQATRNYAKRQLTWFRNQLKEARLIGALAPTPLTEI